jgi:hypothetical protein
MPRTATGKIQHRLLRLQQPQNVIAGALLETPMNEPLAATRNLNADTLACAPWIARFLKGRGIDRIFGLQGGHIQPIWD